MKVSPSLLILFLVLLPSVSADEQLDRALVQFFENTPFPLSYWVVDFQSDAYYESGLDTNEYFSPFRVSYENSQEYVIARTRLVSGRKYYFWYSPAGEISHYFIETAGGAEVIPVGGDRRIEQGKDLRHSIEEAVLLTSKYRSLERHYAPGVPYMMLGNAALSAGCAFLSYILAEETINPAVVLFGTLSAFSIGFAVYEAISNPIVRNRMDDILEDLGTLWE